MTDKVPEELWEAARSLRNAVLWESNSSVEHIARALWAERKRAAETAYRICAETRHVSLGNQARTAILGGQNAE